MKLHRISHMTKLYILRTAAPNLSQNNNNPNTNPDCRSPDLKTDILWLRDRRTQLCGDGKPARSGDRQVEMGGWFSQWKQPACCVPAVVILSTRLTILFCSSPRPTITDRTLRPPTTHVSPPCVTYSFLSHAASYRNCAAIGCVCIWDLVTMTAWLVPYDAVHVYYSYTTLCHWLLVILN